MRKRIISVLLACLLLVALSVQVFADTDDTCISFDFNGVSEGDYDKKVTVNMNAGGSTKFAVNTLYIKTVTNDNIKFKATARIAKNLNKFLLNDSETNFRKNKEVSAANLTNINVRLQQLKDAGVSSKILDSSCAKFYFLAIKGASAEFGYGILVQVKSGGESLTSAQKKPLSDLLATVEDGNSKYYQSGDRYNGKSADTITDKNSGFWAQFIAENGPRAKAQNVLGTATTVKQITTAVTELKAAIDKLIPTSQLNATDLYETLQDQDYSEEFLEKFTKPSVEKFLAARRAAQAYLDSLFDATTGPTENVPANQKKADDMAAGMNLLLVDSDTVEDSKVNKRSIQALDKLYEALSKNSGKYDPTSWKSFTDIRDEAVAYAAQYPCDEYMKRGQPAEYTRLARKFLTKYYELQPASGTVHVTFTYTDDLHLRTPQSGIEDPEQNRVQIGDYELPAGTTLTTLLTKAGCAKGSASINSKGYSIWRVFVNGRMLYGATPGEGQYLVDDGYVLKDGDKIQLVHMQWPVQQLQLHLLASRRVDEHDERPRRAVLQGKRRTDRCSRRRNDADRRAHVRASVELGRRLYAL